MLPGMEGNSITLYLSAILDLCDRRIVSYVLSERNDNPLIYKTFHQAVKAIPDAHPLFHSDRGFQYTSWAFHHKLQQAGMTQSISRVVEKFQMMAQKNQALMQLKDEFGLELY